MISPKETKILKLEIVEHPYPYPFKWMQKGKE
jgi:hypothetical protein